MKKSKRIITVLLAVSLLICTLSVPNAIITDAQESVSIPTVFTTDFSSLTDGEISTTDTQTVNALQDKFIFYHEQEGYYFERPNVNGYLCLEDGTDTYGTVSNKPGIAYYMPDTGHSAIFTNFDGVNNDWNFPMYTIDGKWIYLNAHPCNYTYRHAGIMYPKSTESPTGFASLKNFSIEMDFKFRKFDSNHTQFMDSNCDTLSFYMRQSQIGSIKTVSQSYFNIDISGKATIGTGRGLTGTTVQLKKADGTNTKFVRNKEYHIKVTVVDNTIEYIMKDIKCPVDQGKYIPDNEKYRLEQEYMKFVKKLLAEKKQPPKENKKEEGTKATPNEAPPKTQGGNEIPEGRFSGKQSPKNKAYWVSEVKYSTEKDFTLIVLDTPFGEKIKGFIKGQSELKNGDAINNPVIESRKGGNSSSYNLITAYEKAA